MAGESVLAKMAVVISGQTAEFNKAMKQTQSALSGFQAGIAKIGATIGGAFAAREVAEFAMEVAKLAGEAEGVRAAFDKLPNSIRLMNDLKAATGGTVSELDLMKRSVQASNFGISMEALPKLLEFAAVRAQQTGQSVDYLVDSIVTGIGRKSPLILDNLGISAVALKEKMNGVSIATADVGQVAEAVGKIAAENLESMGTLAETASTKTQRLSASWTNFKVAIGDAANGTGILGKSLDALTLSLDVASSKNISFWEKLKAFTSGPAAISAYLESIGDDHKKAAEQTEKHEQVIREVDRAFKEFGPNLEAYAKTISNHVLKTELLTEYTKRLNKENVTQVRTLASLNEELKLLNDEFETLDVNNKKQLQVTAQKIISINAEIDAIEKLRKAREAEKLMQTKFGRETLNKEADAIGTNRVDPDRFKLDFPQPEGLNEMFPTTAVVTWGDTVIKTFKAVDGIFSELDANNEIRNNRDRVRGEEQRARLEALSAQAAQYGAVMGSVLADVITGQQTMANAMKRVTKEIVATMLARALSSAISTSFSSSGNPVIGAALAAASSAAVLGLFNAIPDGGSHGGRTGGGSIPSVNQSSVQRMNEFTRPADRVVLVQGEWKMRGNDMALVLQKNYNANGRRGGPTEG